MQSRPYWRGKDTPLNSTVPISAMSSRTDTRIVSSFIARTLSAPKADAPACSRFWDSRDQMFSILRYSIACQGLQPRGRRFYTRDLRLTCLPTETAPTYYASRRLARFVDSLVLDKAWADKLSFQAGSAARLDVQSNSAGQPASPFQGG